MYTARTRTRICKRHVHVPATWSKYLKYLPGLLLAACVLIAMSSTRFSLVDLEPFDAWVFQVAGWATLTIAHFSILFPAWTFISCATAQCSTRSSHSSYSIRFILY